MKPALPALLLGLLASTAALNVNRRDALKGTTASVAQIALPTASLAQVALPAVAAGPEGRRATKDGHRRLGVGRQLVLGLRAVRKSTSASGRPGGLYLLFRPPRRSARVLGVLALYSPEGLISAQATTRRRTKSSRRSSRSSPHARTALWIEACMGSVERISGRSVREAPRSRHGGVEVRRAPVAHEPRRRRQGSRGVPQRLGRDSMGSIRYTFPMGERGLLGRARDCYDKGLVKAVGVINDALRTR